MLRVSSLLSLITWGGCWRQRRIRGAGDKERHWFSHSSTEKNSSGFSNSLAKVQLFLESDFLLLWSPERYYEQSVADPAAITVHTIFLSNMRSVKIVQYYYAWPTFPEKNSISFFGGALALHPMFTLFARRSHWKHTQFQSIGERQFVGICNMDWSWLCYPFHALYGWLFWEYEVGPNDMLAELPHATDE
jgi:hypothetical protein